VVSRSAKAPSALKASTFANMKATLALGTFAALATSLAGCDTTAKPQPQTPPSQTAAGADSAPAPAQGPASSASSPGSMTPSAVPSLPAPTAAEAAAFAKANNAFAFDLYRPIGKAGGKAGGNLAFSPASISTALAMTWGGAVGPTSDEMRKMLHFEGSAEEVLTSAGKVAADLQRGDALVLAIANRLFGEKTFTFQKPYLDSTEKLFGAPLEPVDFAGAPDPARQHINQWVAGRTKDRIKDLIPASGIDGETRLVLVNAVYFLADWAEPFDKSATTDLSFWANGKTEKPVPTMRRSAAMPFAEVDGTQLVELPYVGGRFSMLVVVPAQRDGLPALEAKLDVARFDSWVKALATEQVFLSMPKFEIDPPSSIALRDALQSLGMKTAFLRGQADFSKIADPPRPADRLFVGNVFHKAFVKVDEKGTEAAAATAVVMPRGGGAPKKARQLAVDRPFLFFLRDRTTGTILFVGRVVDPSGKG